MIEFIKIWLITLFCVCLVIALLLIVIGVLSLIGDFAAPVLVILGGTTALATIIYFEKKRTGDY